MSKSTHIAVFGAGSWGTAFAIHLAKAGLNVTLWGHDKTHIKKLTIDLENKKHLPGAPLPSNLQLSYDFIDVWNQCSLPIIAVPSHAFVETIDKIPNEIKQIAWLTKGLEPKSSRFLSSVVLEKSPNALIAILQGPSFAKELALGLPTAITLAHNDHSFGQKVQSLIHTPPLRVYLSDDIIGVQLAGAVKNVLAIAVGISDGLGFGANTKAALITRGLNEMARLGAKLNANKATFMGLAGLGDLLLTATDDQSRNRRFGLLLGQGMSTAHALSEIKQVVEGIHNVEQVLALSKSVHIELPICETVSRILNNKISAKDAVSALLNRPKSYE